mgnify:CR=1 FL=1
MNNLFSSKDCECVVCLGDLTDKPDLTSEEITALSKCGLKDHVMIVGNHCRSDKDGNINSLSIFNDVISKPEIRQYGSCRVLFLPYNSTTYDLSEFNNVDLIFSHNDIKGYNYGNAVSCSGYELEDILGNCKLFINGHLHNGGWLVKDRIVNLGQLSGMNFSSCGGEWEPSVGILDTETLNLEIISNPEAYRFKKVEFGTLVKLKNYLDSILNEEGHYVLQVKVPFSISDKARKLINQNCKVVASRVTTYHDNTENRSAKQEGYKKEFEVSNKTVYDQLKDFLTTQSESKYNKKIVGQIISEIEGKEGVD